jgi:hypothetical protein
MNSPMSFLQFRNWCMVHDGGYQPSVWDYTRYVNDSLAESAAENARLGLNTVTQVALPTVQLPQNRQTHE